MIELLKKLDGFRESEHFKRFGFANRDTRINGLWKFIKGPGVNYNPWIKEVEKLSQSSDNNTHECASILANIGYAYAISKGKNTDHIKELREYFDEKILQNM